MCRCPYRAPGYLSTSRPAGRNRLPGFDYPSTTTRASPLVKRAVYPRLSSARRLSQPLSGFPASSSSTALFRAATVPGLLLQSFPLTGIARPSRGHIAPLWLSTSVQERTARVLIAASFTDSRTFGAQSPGSLNGYGSPFHEPKPASWSPWVTNSGTTPFRQLHPLRSLDPPASPFAPLRVTPERRSILSWFSAPPETIRPDPGPSNPPRP